MLTRLHTMTEGPLWKQILLFSFPLMLSNVLQVLFNMSDVAVVGRFAGAQALGSVGSTTTLVALFTGFLLGMGSGVNALAARFYGAGDRRAMDAAASTGAVVCLGAGVILLLAGSCTCGALLSLLNTREDLMDGAVRYLRIYLLGMPALALYNFGNAILSAMGETRRPLYYLSAAGVVNVLLNLFFVIVCGMSVAGVAIASVISQYLSAALILRFLVRSQSVYGLHLSAGSVTRARAMELLGLGLPAGLQNAIFQIANLFIQAGVNSFPSVVVEGNAAAANADALVYDVMAAFYTACSSFMGQNYGAGRWDRVMKSYRISLVYSFGTGVVLGLSLVALSRPFLSLFAVDPLVLEAGRSRLKIMGLSYAVSAFMDCTIAASRGLGKSLVPTVIVIMGSCVFRVVWVYTVFAYFGTISSLYLLYVFSWSITAVAEIVYFSICCKKQLLVCRKC